MLMFWKNILVDVDLESLGLILGDIEIPGEALGRRQQ